MFMFMFIGLIFITPYTSKTTFYKAIALVQMFLNFLCMVQPIIKNDYILATHYIIYTNDNFYLFH